LIVLSPEGKAQTSAAKVAGVARFTDLRGKTLGVLDNSKPNADNLAKRLGELLIERYGVAKVISRRKLTAQQGAPKQYLEELAAQADIVLCGLGD
jgi:phosphoglycerate dehydrogenase-like enzyme